MCMKARTESSIFMNFTVSKYESSDFDAIKIATNGFICSYESSYRHPWGRFDFYTSCTEFSKYVRIQTCEVGNKDITVLLLP